MVFLRGHGALSRCYRYVFFRDQTAVIQAEHKAILEACHAHDSKTLRETIAALHAPRHPNCYLSPTQFAVKFGTDKPRRVEAPNADRDLSPGVTAAPTEQRAAVLRTTVSEEELADQQFVEVHVGVPIFRLADGRYHVISHFAVASLEDARAAADSLGAVVNSKA